MFDTSGNGHGYKPIGPKRTVAIFAVAAGLAGIVIGTTDHRYIYEGICIKKQSNPTIIQEVRNKDCMHWIDYNSDGHLDALRVKDMYTHKETRKTAITPELQDRYQSLLDHINTAKESETTFK